mgnify:CR=1 FL=1
MTSPGHGRIRVPEDLDSVTAVGSENAIDPSEAAAVERIWQAARYWYSAGMQPAIQVCIRRGDRVVLNRAIGHAWGNGPNDPVDAEQIPVSTDTPFCVYSAAKAISTTVVHMLVERGELDLDARVCDYLPTYTSHGKDRTGLAAALYLRTFSGISGDEAIARVRQVRSPRAIENKEQENYIKKYAQKI